jgi:hypothetical protein
LVKINIQNEWLIFILKNNRGFSQVHFAKKTLLKSIKTRQLSQELSFFLNTGTAFEYHSATKIKRHENSQKICIGSIGRANDTWF